MSILARSHAAVAIGGLHCRGCSAVLPPKWFLIYESVLSVNIGANSHIPNNAHFGNTYTLNKSAVYMHMMQKSSKNIIIKN